MPISEMLRYVELQQEGEATLHDRRAKPHSATGGRSHIPRPEGEATFHDRRAKPRSTKCKLDYYHDRKAQQVN